MIVNSTRTGTGKRRHNPEIRQMVARTLSTNEIRKVAGLDPIGEKKPRRSAK